MTGELLISTILISLALVFYSVGVWSERLADRLKGWHLVFFWGGLAYSLFHRLLCLYAVKVTVV